MLVTWLPRHISAETVTVLKPNQSLVAESLRDSAGLFIVVKRGLKALVYIYMSGIITHINKIVFQAVHQRKQLTCSEISLAMLRNGLRPRSSCIIGIVKYSIFPRTVIVCFFFFFFFSWPPLPLLLSVRGILVSYFLRGETVKQDTQRQAPSKFSSRTIG